MIIAAMDDTNTSGAHKLFLAASACVVVILTVVVCVALLESIPPVSMVGKTDAQAIADNHTPPAEDDSTPSVTSFPSRQSGFSSRRRIRRIRRIVNWCRGRDEL
jgi:hypothetical protein